MPPVGLLSFVQSLYPAEFQLLSALQSQSQHICIALMAVLPVGDACIPSFAQFVGVPH